MFIPLLPRAFATANVAVCRERQQRSSVRTKIGATDRERSVWKYKAEPCHGERKSSVAYTRVVRPDRDNEEK